MNTIKSVILQVNAHQVIKLQSGAFPLPDFHPGQRISLLQVDEQPFFFPKFAHLLNNGKYLEILLQEPLNLKPGQSLILSRPAGVGFSDLGTSVRILMIIGDSDHSFLFNLIQQIPLSKNIEVSVLTTGPNYNYPEWVEMITTSQFIDTCTWANRVYLEASQSNLEEVIDYVFKNIDRKDQKKVEIFTQPNYACAGIGECGLCAINILNQKILLCQQGPVLKLAEFLRK